MKEHILPGTPVTTKKKKKQSFKFVKKEVQKRAVGIEPGTFAKRLRVNAVRYEGN